MAKTVLVTAEVGFIGSQLADELLVSAYRDSAASLEKRAATRFDGPGGELLARGST